MRNRESICWQCQNAVPNPEKGYGCSWSVSFTPVDGWECIEYMRDEKYNGTTRKKQAYCVVSCPKFIKEERKNESKKMPLLW